MNLIGKKVTHASFGEGAISNLEDNKIKVDFQGETKLFLFPQAFEKNLVAVDKKAEAYVFEILEKQRAVKEVEQEKKRKEDELKIYVKKLKIPINSQVAFGMMVNDLDQILDTGCIFTGNHLSGNHKGEPCVPKNVNMNSACILTVTDDKSHEAERRIVGMFLPTENFIGARCLDGMISVHKKHRIIWDADQEEILFWKYFPSKIGLRKWGSNEMKYVPNTVAKEIIEDMAKLAEDESQITEIAEFYHYFCQLNHLKEDKLKFDSAL